MPPPIFPSASTSYIELFLMALMGLNHLLDDAPHHLLFSKREKERARRLETHARCRSHQPLGFVTEIPDERDEAFADYQDECPPWEATPPVPSSGKEAYPFVRSFYDGEEERGVKGGREREVRREKEREVRREREREVSDAWVKMRGMRGREGRREGSRGEGNGKRVRFEREVRWWVFDGEEGG